MKLAEMADTPLAEIEQQVDAGGRFVVYEYCVSFVILSTRRSSEIHYIPPGTSVLVPGLGYTLRSLLLGWWGIPWGPIWTVWVSIVNLRGGRDVTQGVMSHLRGEAPDVPLEGRVRCLQCGYDSSGNRRTCKNCRAPL
jgi:hypothetical protein